MKTYVITATPPTSNGDLHVGHLSGPYLAADVFARYQRLRGARTVSTCSSDDNQSYVVTTARRRGCTPEELTARSTEAILTTLRLASIELDAYTSSLGNERHNAFVQAFFRDLYDRGVIVAREARGLWCPTCDRSLFESFVVGTCPFCGEAAAGNLCEACARVNDPVDLLEPRCRICGGTPEETRYNGLFLPLERYREQLAKFYETRTSWRPHVVELCRALTAQPLPDYPVSYQTDWGIPVPIDGFEGQAINVWFEMYPGHVATTSAWAAGQGDESLGPRLWSGDATVVQFLGYDNSFFNAVLHVTLAMASDGYVPADHLVVNEFYLLDGLKFSTSAGHAIWGNDILREVDADRLRYYLARTNPEHMQTDFRRADFEQRVAAEVDGVWRSVIDRTLALARAGAPPAPDEIDLGVRGLVGWARVWLERFYDVEEFSLRNASATLHAYVQGCDDYLTRKVEPGPGDGKALGSMLCLLTGLAMFSAPLMPGFAQRLWEELGRPGTVQEAGWADIEHPAEIARA